MMMSPQTFVNQYKEMSYKELLLVRDEMLEEIRAFEAEPYNPAEDLIDPPADFVYLCNLDYLGKLLELISEKYRQEFIRNEDDDYEDDEDEDLEKEEEEDNKKSRKWHLF
ncbi:MAG: hypothetical protein IKG39_11935 [Lachnospiraceae bacterium]|nr:hypothetical protein [Lachnospiraceae bacterium]